MQKDDLKLLWLFTFRIGMYTGKTNRDTVMSFLYGYETGRHGLCKFTEKLSTSIYEEFGVEKLATGLLGQIIVTAEKLDSNWIAIFKQQSLKTLLEEFPTPIEKRAINFFKSKVIGIANYKEKSIREHRIRDWLDFIALSSDWFKKMWTEKELKIITEIEKELKLFGQIETLELSPTAKLNNSFDELLKETEGQDQGLLLNTVIENW